MDIKKLSLIISGTLILIFFLQNTQVVTIRILFWQISMSRIILLGITLLVGMVLGFFVAKRKYK
ncbi:MAG: LapA family protein [Candidatus Omnitrophica bacterium]|nr:LapA family protein [Candidatus Omnitrophota bacterium]MDD5081598.1 LapA family protein [Candidatus Omnitrophota bacterium]MDD5441208.1 LapA family protein [Candidatus Omnitrophota bacterium]